MFICIKQLPIVLLYHFDTITLLLPIENYI